MSLNSNLTNALEITIQQNQATTADNLFYSFTSKTVQYYNVNARSYRVENINANFQNKIARMYFNLDRTSESYERVVYSFIDMFGFLGGLFDFMFFLGLYFVDYFSDKMYHNSIFAKLYQVKSQDDDFGYESKRFDDFQNSPKLSKSGSFRLEKASQVDENISETNFNLQNDPISYIQNLRQEFKARRKYSYVLSDNIKNSLKLL